ncbi:MAG: hypoxanthine phosphoribosyltransferase [Syntrophobacteraceae bacterium]|nr:hypoxanthine phosphoribosyltransferase [Desulfobacteraceae bacterium]
MENYCLVPKLTAEDLQIRLDELAARINQDYQDQPLVLIGVLKGAFIFLADLVRRLAMPVHIDFVRLASYGSAAESSGRVRITKDIETDIEGLHVLIVEDIVDTGTTLAWYLEELKRRKPASVKICALIDKYERREREVPVAYTGIRVETGFLVGYGLDYSEKHRNLPGIYEVQFLK